MASKTTNYNLHKIDLTDAPPDITVLNENFDVLDRELAKAADGSIVESINDKLNVMDTNLNDKLNKLIASVGVGKSPKTLTKQTVVTQSETIKPMSLAAEPYSTGVLIGEFVPSITPNVKVKFKQVVKFKNIYYGVTAKNVMYKSTNLKTWSICYTFPNTAERRFSIKDIRVTDTFLVVSSYYKDILYVTTNLTTWLTIELTTVAYPDFIHSIDTNKTLAVAVTQDDNNKPVLYYTSNGTATTWSKSASSVEDVPFKIAINNDYIVMVSTTNIYWKPIANVNTNSWNKINISTIQGLIGKSIYTIEKINDNFFIGFNQTCEVVHFKDGVVTLLPSMDLWDSMPEIVYTSGLYWFGTESSNNVAYTSSDLSVVTKTTLPVLYVDYQTTHILQIKSPTNEDLFYLENTENTTDFLGVETIFYSLVATEYIQVGGVTLVETSVNLEIGDTKPLVATVTPTNASDKTVWWSTNNSAIATVSNTGLITAIASGTATITVTTKDGGHSATCTVNVKIATVPVTNVELNKNTLSLEVDNTDRLIASVLPENATNKNITWVSGDNSVATVESGLITAIASGTTTITVTTEDGGHTATCNVTVTKLVTNVSLNKTTLNLIVGNTETLTATIVPDDATNKNVSWSSDNPEVATVNDGLVTAITAGETNIVVTTEDGNKVASCTVTVEPVEEQLTLTLNKATANADVGETVDLTATTNSTSPLLWSSDDETVATVLGAEKTATITAIKAGTATITVKTTDETLSATCVITVKRPTISVTNITINKTEVSLEVSKTNQLVSTIVPSNATNQTVAWRSSNAEVATVNNTGLITALKVGTAVITVTTADGNYTATCTVTVTLPEEQPDNPDNPDIYPVGALSLHEKLGEIDDVMSLHDKIGESNDAQNSVHAKLNALLEGQSNIPNGIALEDTSQEILAKLEELYIDLYGETLPAKTKVENLQYTFRDVTFDGSNYYGISGNGIYKSSDLLNWKQVSSYGGNSICASGSGFIAASYQHDVIESEDGELWNSNIYPVGSTVGKDLAMLYCAYVDGVYMAFGSTGKDAVNNLVGGDLQITYSSNLSDWQSTLFAGLSGDNLGKPATGNGRIVLPCRTVGGILYGGNDINEWRFMEIPYTNPTSGTLDFIGVTFANDKFIVRGTPREEEKFTMVSSDGDNWSKVVLNVDINPHSICYQNGLYYVFEYTGGSLLKMASGSSLTTLRLNDVATVASKFTGQITDFKTVDDSNSFFTCMSPTETNYLMHHFILEDSTHINGSFDDINTNLTNRVKTEYNRIYSGAIKSGEHHNLITLNNQDGRLKAVYAKVTNRTNDSTDANKTATLSVAINNVRSFTAGISATLAGIHSTLGSYRGSAVRFYTQATPVEDLRLSVPFKNLQIYIDGAGSSALGYTVEVEYESIDL